MCAFFLMEVVGVSSGVLGGLRKSLGGSSGVPREGFNPLLGSPGRVRGFCFELLGPFYGFFDIWIHLIDFQSLFIVKMNI